MKVVMPLLALALVQPALAQGLSGAEATLLPRVIETACFDLIEAYNGCEQVSLLTSETSPDAADLIILTDRRTDPSGAPLLVARSIVFNGPMWGMSPTLAQAGNGSLLVSAEQTGIGRHAWNQTLTLAWRGDAFVVAGYTWSSYDRLDAGSVTCDVNLLTGDYVASAVRPTVDGQGETVLVDDRGRIAPMVYSPTVWTLDTPAPAPCTAAIDRLFEE